MTISRCSRLIDQLSTLNQADLFRRGTVADFMLEKDALFARLNLKDDELRLYEQIYDHLKPQAPTPDLVIYLQAAPDTLIERVQRRGTPYEKNIPDPYLVGLAETYTRFFYQYADAPLLIVNSDRLNFVESQDDVDEPRRPAVLLHEHDALGIVLLPDRLVGMVLRPGIVARRRDLPTDGQTRRAAGDHEGLAGTNNGARRRLHVRRVRRARK